MKIENSTRWTTGSLRKIFGACMKELRRREGKTLKPFDRWRIAVVDHRTFWVGGYAYYNSTALTLKVPVPDGQRFRRTISPIKRWPPKKSEVKILPPDLKFSQEVADVFFHELGHCLGVRHVTARQERVSDGRPFCVGVTIELSFRKWIQEAITEDFILVEKITTAPTRDFQIERQLRAVANLKKAETRHKRATTLLKKWRKKVRYYDKIRGPITNPKEEN